MIVVALTPPPALEAVYIPNAESEFDQSVLVRLWREGGRVPATMPRTSSTSDAWPTRELVTTTSSHIAQGATLAVTVNLGDRLPLAVGEDNRVPSMLSDIRRMTGWSWERLAEAMGRTRQAVHAWTLGREITRQNLERLARLHATLAFVDRSDAEQNRALLLTAAPDGSLVGDLLEAGRFDEVRTLLGPGDGGQQRADRLRFASRVQKNERGMHWFDRLAETRGEEQPLEIVTSGERRRIAVRRRG